MTPQNILKIFKVLLPILIILTVVTYYHRFPTGDDAWFAEQSYWLLHDRVIRSEFFHGFWGWEYHVFPSHKLFLAVDALLMGLFGETLYVAKLSGLLFFLLLIYLFYRYIKQRKLPSTAFYWVLFLLFSNILVIKLSFENRPEMMLATLGFASFLLIQKENYLSIILGGIVGGMAILTHLNGIIYLVAGGSMFLYNRKIKEATLFCISGSLVAILYFYDIWLAKGFDLWHYQFFNDPATQSSFGLLSKLKVMVNFPILFFKTPEQVAISVLLIASLAIYWEKLNEIPKNLHVYGVSLLVSFWLLTKAATGIYEMLFIPTMILIIIELFNSVEYSFTKSKMIWYSLALYVVIGVFGIFQLIHKIATNPYLPDQYKEISKYIPKKTNGLVPITFFFNEYKNYKNLRCYDDFYLQMWQLKQENSDVKMLQKWLMKKQISFLLFDYKNEFSNAFPKYGSLIDGYTLKYVDADKQFVIYVAENENLYFLPLISIIKPRKN